MGALRTGNGRERGGGARYLRCHAVNKGLDCRMPMMRMVDAQSHLLTRLSSESFLEILRSGDGSERQSALAAAIREQATAQGEASAISRALEAGEAALQAEQDAAVVGVLARRHAGLEAQQVEAQQRLALAEGKLQQLESGPSREQLGEEARAQVGELMRTFALQEDTVEDRRRVHAHLLRLGLRVTVDGKAKRIGLSIGDRTVAWEPLAPKARRLALETGRINPERAVDHQAMGKAIPVVIDARSGTSEELEQFMGGDGDDQSDGVTVSVDLEWDEEKTQVSSCESGAGSHTPH
jgi:hypothetical protein